MSGTRARDWFADEADFRTLCGDAVSLARGERSQEFAGQMMINAKAYGLQTFVSPAQLKYLCKLADWVAPRRITNEETGE